MPPLCNYNNNDDFATEYAIQGVHTQLFLASLFTLMSAAVWDYEGLRRTLQARGNELREQSHLWPIQKSLK